MFFDEYFQTMNLKFHIINYIMNYYIKFSVVFITLLYLLHEINGADLRHNFIEMSWNLSYGCVYVCASF